MIFFTVSKNINIKLTDSSIIKLFRPEDKNNVEFDRTYITTYDDIKSIKDIFLRVGDDYKLCVEDEKKFNSIKAFPRELGIENKNEFNILTYTNELNLNEKTEDIFSQITTIKKDIKIAIIGGVGKNIGEMICALSSVRILKKKLEQRFKTVSIDLFIKASDNKFYIRDKELLKSGIGINRIAPLPINIKTFCLYDFYIDTSSIEKTYYYEHLPYVDSYLHKFGIDYTKVADSEKYNKLNPNRKYRPSRELKTKIAELKSRGKVLLVHPFSPDINRSMPKDIAIKLIKKLMKKLPDHTIISALKIDGAIEVSKDKNNIYKDNRFEDISKYSKSFFDFSYIISNMDKIITIDTSTYHIADIYFVPCIVIFNDKKLIDKRIKYYQNMEYTLLDNKNEKSFSSLKFDTPELVLNKLDSWRSLKVKNILKKFESLD